MNSSDEVEIDELYEKYVPRCEELLPSSPQRITIHTQTTSPSLFRNNCIKSSKVLQSSNELSRHYRHLRSLRPLKIIPRQKNICPHNMDFDSMSNSGCNSVRSSQRIFKKTPKKSIKPEPKFIKLQIPELKISEKINRSIDNLIHKKKNIKLLDTNTSIDRIISSNKMQKKIRGLQRKKSPFSPKRFHNKNQL